MDNGFWQDGQGFCNQFSEKNFEKVSSLDLKKYVELKLYNPDEFWEDAVDKMKWINTASW
jgi:phosphoribosylformylglycinamidine (FGAM) synthase PurS component